MPTEVFDDLWQALNAGRSWTGLIKNRNKKGGFYWVLENITPIVANAWMVG
ncbi:MAG: PAS domain-containing protein [Methylobacter sp.]|nr:PAS domain-containing protein [Methylobacter sp.]